MAKQDKRHMFDDRRNVRRVIYALLAVCGLSIIAEIFVERHIDHPWEASFGFYGVYGFVACVVLVLLAKEMRKFLMRAEDYYDE